MPTGQSLFHKFPNYRVDLEPSRERVRVTLDGELLADSQRAIVVRETKHDPVLYFPREDVRIEQFERTEHHTVCPFKGEASYWTLRAGEQTLENSAWSYEDPFEEVAGLKDHVAFYADRVEIEVT